MGLEPVEFILTSKSYPGPVELCLKINTNDETPHGVQILENINHCINDKMARENNDKHSGQKTPR